MEKKYGRKFCYIELYINTYHTFVGVKSSSSKSC